MMKKIYSRPDTEIVKIAAVKLLDISMNINGDYDKDEITLGSRRTDSWDDDEYESWWQQE